MIPEVDPAHSKAQLLADLDAAGKRVAARLSALPAADFERGGYESGWNGRQILAHVAAIEWTYPRLVDLARASASPGGGNADISGFDINAYNQRLVDKRADASVADLIAEFQRNRAATIVAYEVADDALLAVPITSAGSISGTLAEVIRYTAIEHVDHHLDDITGSR